MNEGVLSEWRFADGAEVTQGAVLYLLESDKSVEEIEAPASGRLRIVQPAGTSCSVGTVLGFIE